jgi:hypothetical protein
MTYADAPTATCEDTYVEAPEDTCILVPEDTCIVAAEATYTGGRSREERAN